MKRRSAGAVQVEAWREAEVTRRPVAWLTLDERDSDPVVLWAHVIKALGQACPDLGQSVSLEMAGAAQITDVVLPRLVNELDQQDPVTLILDDFHRIAGGAASDSVAWLVDHAPPGFQLVSRRGQSRLSGWRRCAPTVSCSSCAPTICGSPARRPGRS